MTETSDATARRTIRRFAHELYPHGEEGEVRPLAVEVPYLYAMAVGLDTWGSDWYEVYKRKGQASAALVMNRTVQMIDARRTALLADALLQGLSGDDAWRWAEERMDEEGEWVYKRATRYGVRFDQIKPYPVLAEATDHDHRELSEHGYINLVRVQCRESDCPDCTEDVTP